MKKIIKINFAVSLFAFLALCSMSIYFNYELNQNVPNILEYKKIISNGISFERLTELKEQCTDLMITGYTEIPCEIKNKYGILPSRNIKTKVVLTDDNYFALYPNNFLEGGKLDYLSSKNGDKVAVISDKLANDLYRTTKVDGNIISINDVKFKIIGVYETNKSFTYSISEDGYDRIFIPYSAYTFADKSVNSIIDVFSIQETAKNTSSKINSKLHSELGSNISLYNLDNYTLSKKLTFQYIRILCFVIGSCMIIILIKLLIMCIRGFIDYCHDCLKTNYLVSVIKDNSKLIIIFLVKVFLLIISIIIIFSLIRFNIVIKENYLPPDNLFDFKFYVEAIVRDMQLINANQNGFSNVYNRYITNICRIEKNAFVVECLTFILIIINGKALISFRKRYRK